jgi:hypothetical protein
VPRQKTVRQSPHRTHAELTRLNATVAAHAVVSQRNRSQPDKVTWLHFNLSDARARRWLLDAAFVPAAFREVLRRASSSSPATLLAGAASGGVTLALLFWRRLL